MNHKMNYGRLGLMVAFSFISMYVLMYAMVDTLANVLPNFNQFYMAGLMTSPMVVIELLLMGKMYPSAKINTGIILVSIVALILFWTGVREQIAVDDEQFLKSMIPHHAAAILMCKKVSLEDTEISELCRNIISGQQVEIDFMKSKLHDLKTR